VFWLVSRPELKSYSDLKGKVMGTTTLGGSHHSSGIRPAFTNDEIPTDEEISEYLKEDARILGLAAPLPAARVFDFSIQREVNQELRAR
jgi:hypothetical protein